MPAEVITSTRPFQCDIYVTGRGDWCQEGALSQSVLLRALWKGKRSRFGLPVMGASLLVRGIRGRQPAVNLLLHYLFFFFFCALLMRFSGDAGIGFFQHKANEVCFALVALAGGHDGMRQEKAPLLYFFSLFCILQEAFKFDTLICKIILFWLCRRRWLWVQTDHQTDWRLISVFFPLHESPAVISISLPILLCCGSAGVRGCFLVWLLKQALLTCCSYKPTATRQFNRASQEAAYSWARLPVQRTQSACSYGPVFLGRPMVVIANRSSRGVGKGMQLMREWARQTQQFCLFSSAISTNARKSVCKSILPWLG